MGASASKTNYVPDSRISNAKALAKYQTSFYGRMTPNSPDGKDLGLSEPAPCWDFPKSDENSVIVLPEWSQTKAMGIMWDHKWSHTAFDPEYKQQLGQFGITQANYTTIITGLNLVLESFAPFTRNQDEYLTELRKHLTQATQDFPKSIWELHIHKYATELSSVLFFENVYHSIKVTDASAIGEAAPELPNYRKKETEETEAASEETGAASDAPAAETAQPAAETAQPASPEDASPENKQ